MASNTDAPNDNAPSRHSPLRNQNPHGATRTVGELLDAMLTASDGTASDALLNLMTATPTGPHQIKGLLPAGTIVAHRTGGSGTVNALTRATQDAGLVTFPDGRHLAVVVFVSDTRAAAATRDRVIAQIARAAWDHRQKL